MRRVALLASGDEGKEAWRWLKAVPEILARRLKPRDDLPPDGADLIWVHDVGGVEPGEHLRAWLDRGGRLLLTLRAVDIPTAIGLEPLSPDDVRSGRWRHEDDEFWLDEYRSFQAFPHIRGLGTFGPHPLFAGLDQGTYTWAPAEGEPYHWVAWRDRWPEMGRVVAVERSFIHLNPGRAVAWEFQVGRGGVLCLGAFVSLTAPDQLLSRQLHAVLLNAIRGQAIPHADRRGEVVVWPGRAPSSPPDRIEVPDLPELSEPWDEVSNRFTIRSDARDDDPWTQAGRRMLLTGGERSGLKEVWCHPFRVLRDAHLLVDGEAGRSIWVDAATDRVERVFERGSVTAAERWATAVEAPIFSWEIEAPGAGIEVGGVMDLRRMWPYPAGVYGRPWWRFGGNGPEPDRSRLLVGATDGPVRVLWQLVGGRFEEPELVSTNGVAVLRIAAKSRERLRVVCVAGAWPDELERAVRLLRRDGLRARWTERTGHADWIRTHWSSIETPSPETERAFEWAKVRVDGFLAETPGLGRSLLAGYATSRPGWGDGRPGYAWYFGRDACWTAFGALAAGDREVTRDVIRFLSRTQDVTGKVLHEYPTSGLVHYDAADSTPLYLLLVARYVAWTGDLAYVKRYWAAIRAAYRFLLETDRDGDGVIENYRIGHGWIEHGPLGGAAVTLYLAACWIAALEGLAPVARALDDTALADELEERAARARKTVRTRFRVDQEYVLGLRHDGTAVRHRTAMLAVPLLLGVVPPEEVPGWFDEIASDRFSAPWGVRMIAVDDPLFEPEGYHRGAVWPLYTGWVSLAEWAGGRYRAGLDHLLANTNLALERAKGAFDEVLHGTERRAAGICPDQAWSASMVLSPVIEGMWGVVPDALAGAVRLAPYLPPAWPEQSLRRLRIGETALDLRLRRRSSDIVLSLAHLGGPPLRIATGLRHEGSVGPATVNDEPLGRPEARFELAQGEATVRWAID